MHVIHDDSQFLVDPVAVNIPASDEDLAREIKRMLIQHYPGFMWAIEMPAGQNIVVIRNYDLDPQGKMGMIAYKTSIWSDPNLKTLMRYAGEFLERGNRARGKWRREDQPVGLPVLDHG